MMMYTRQSRIALFLLALAISLVASTAMAAPVRIGISERVAAWPLLVAQERGYFEKRGVEVILVPMESAQAPFDLLDDDAIDLTTLTADQLLLADKFGYEVNGVLLLGESIGADVIVATEAIDSTRRLRGTRVGFEASGAGELLLRHALQRKGLSLDDVQSVRLPAPWAGNDEPSDTPPPEALVLQAPWSSEQLPDGLENTLYSSASTAGLIMDTLAGPEPWIDRNKESLKRIIRAWDDAIAWQARRPSAAAEIIAQTWDLDAADTEEWMSSVRYLGTEENVQALRGDYQKSFMAMSEIMQSVLGSDRGVLSANDYFSLAALRQVAAGQ